MVNDLFNCTMQYKFSRQDIILQSEYLIYFTPEPAEDIHVEPREKDFLKFTSVKKDQAQIKEKTLEKRALFMSLDYITL